MFPCFRQLCATILLFVISHFPFFTSAQSKKADSLQKDLENYTKRDTTYINKLNNAGMLLYSSQPKITQQYGDEALTLSKKLKYLTGIAHSHYTLGSSYYAQGQYPDANQHYRKALDFYQKVKDNNSTAKVQLNLGMVAIWQANYKQAITYYVAAAERFKHNNNKGALANCYNGLGVVHKRRGEFTDASKYYKLALEGFRAVKHQAGIASAYLNLGRISQVQEKYNGALNYFFKALAISQKVNNKRHLSTCYHNIGEIKATVGRHKEAIEFYQKSIAIEKEFKSLPGQAYTYNYVAESYRKMEVYDKANDFLALSRKLAQKSNARNELKDNYLFQSRLDSSQGKHLEALQAFKKHTMLKDSLFNIQKSKQIAQMETRFKTKQKEHTILLLEERERTQENVIKKQHLLIGIIGLGLFTALTLAYVLFRYYINKKKNNEQLTKLNYELNQHQDEIITQRDFIEEQRNRVEEQNRTLAEQNTNITKSLQAANHLQRATLPTPTHISNILPQHFVVYHPKDIVSGDFYWIENVDDQAFVIMGDGTGHGVPGAFMALIATTLLDRIITNWRITEPASILTMMHQEIRNVLHQQDNNDQNGVDMAICAIKRLTAATLQITFAGARRPLLFVPPDTQEIQELKATRKSIGGFRKTNGSFEQNCVEVSDKSIFYLFTDGYSDQNNALRQKFGQQRFRDMLYEVHQQDMTDQEEQLEKALSNFMIDTEQRDDIAVMGWKMA